MQQHNITDHIISDITIYNKISSLLMTLAAGHKDVMYSKLATSCLFMLLMSSSCGRSAHTTESTRSLATEELDDLTIINAGSFQHTGSTEGWTSKYQNDLHTNPHPSNDEQRDTTEGWTSKDLLKTALEKVSRKCVDAVTACTSLSDHMKELIQEKKYCEVMSNLFAAGCLHQQGCSSSEVDGIKQTVCAQPKTTPATVETDLLKTALDKVSNKCQDAVKACTSLSEDAKRAIQEKRYCDIMSNPLAAGCLLQQGCLSSEVDSIKQTVCAQPNTTPAAVETDLLKTALEKVSKKCQDAFTACTSLSDQAKGAIQEKRYCELMSNPLAAGCMRQQGCSSSEVGGIKQTVCAQPNTTPATVETDLLKALNTQTPTTPRPSTVTTMENATTPRSSKYTQTTVTAASTSITDPTDLLTVALTKVSQTCETGVWTCMGANPSAKELLQEKKYCTVMNNPLASKCLLMMKCTDKEVRDIKQTVCAVKTGHTSPSTTGPEFGMDNEDNLLISALTNSQSEFSASKLIKAIQLLLQEKNGLLFSSKSVHEEKAQFSFKTLQ